MPHDTHHRKSAVCRPWSNYNDRERKLHEIHILGSIGGAVRHLRKDVRRQVYVDAMCCQDRGAHTSLWSLKGIMADMMNLDIGLVLAITSTMAIGLYSLLSPRIQNLTQSTGTSFVITKKVRRIYKSSNRNLEIKKGWNGADTL